MKKLKVCSACQEEKVIWKNHEGNKYLTKIFYYICNNK